MKIKPTRYEIENYKGLAIEVEIDPESTLEGPLFFTVTQDTDSMVLTEQAASDLVIAMKMLIEGRK
jgi:hypothetical protein